jgi:hypothetical protein
MAENSQTPPKARVRGEKLVPKAAVVKAPISAPTPLAP